MESKFELFEKNKLAVKSFSHYVYQLYLIIREAG